MNSLNYSIVFAGDFVYGINESYITQGWKGFHYEEYL